MAPTSTQFSTMGTYDDPHPHPHPLQYSVSVSTWHDAFEGHSSHSPFEARLTTNNESLESSRDLRNDNISDKLQRRLAQNREAARKSRLKKKAYVQELESGRLKLAKLEHEIERTRQQGSAYVGGNFDSGIAMFETKYDLWVVEQHKKESELMTILQTDVSDVELRTFVDGIVNHYQDLFRMKSDAAKGDAFSLLYGSWILPVERLFQWLGGFRPSGVLYILMPWFEPLTDTQVVNLSKLRHTCRQAEDALTQGIDKLEQTLAQSVGINMTEGGSYDIQMRSAMEGLEALENFSNQADHLRHRTLQQMSRILTVRQAARGLVALGEYFQRLRVLNSLWSARPHGIGS